MARLTYTEITDYVKDFIIANTSTDAPITFTSGTEGLRAVNFAYLQVWEEAERGITVADSNTAWVAAFGSVSSGTTGLLTDIREIELVSFTADATSNPTGVPVPIMPYDYVKFLKSATLSGTYDTPKACSVTRIQTTTQASIGKVRLDYHPVPAGNAFFPIEYTKQFIPFDATGTNVPDVNDLESYDIALLAAIILAPRDNREHLIDELEAQFVSVAGKSVLRKRRSLLASYEAGDGN